MAQGNVEIWLGALLKVSLDAVNAVIKQAHVAVGDPNFALMEFLNTFPAQVITNTSLSFSLFPLSFSSLSLSFPLFFPIHVF